MIDTLSISDFGGHFLKVLIENRPWSLWNLAARKYAPASFPGESIEPGDGGVSLETPFASAFGGLVPAEVVKSVLPRPVRRRREGTYVFEVSLGSKVSRTLALSHKHTLEDLHLAIQKALAFDNDHLYAFFMDAKRWSEDSYNDSRGSEPPFGEEAVLGELDLYVGQKFLYLFDFGDNWEFEVVLREVRDQPFQGRPKVIARQGQAPEQYPRW